MSRRQGSLMVMAAACAGVVAFAPLSARAATATWDAFLARGIGHSPGKTGIVRLSLGGSAQDRAECHDH